jgi:hypothetical protein
MKLILERTGVSAIARTVDDSWQSWAYDEATRQQVGRMDEPVCVRVIPYVRDWRGIVPSERTWPVIEAILDGLVAAGVLESKKAVLEVTLRRPVTNGQSALTVELTDGSEPF